LLFVKHYLEAITHIFPKAAPTAGRRHIPFGRFSNQTTAGIAFGLTGSRVD
jgi:hypothetical protein